MTSILKILCFAPLALSLSASSPVATITSYEPFTLDGHSVGIPGVSSWPLISGDEIHTLASPALLVLENGDKLEVFPNSTVRIAGSSTKPEVFVTSGKAGELGKWQSSPRFPAEDHEPHRWHWPCHHGPCPISRYQ